MHSSPAAQSSRRDRLYAVCRDLAPELWTPDGGFHMGGRWASDVSDPAHGFRGALWHCLALYGEDPVSNTLADRIVASHVRMRFCHFAPSAAVDLLHHSGDRIGPEASAILRGYLGRFLPELVTDDLRVRGFNDNHPFKAAQALLVGGRMLGRDDLCETGLNRLREARQVYRRNGFPCEFNSPNYAPVSLQPLATIAGWGEATEAGELARELEAFIWRDVAVHFDARAGVCAGAMSRAGRNDFEGMGGNSLMLLMHLWPERFVLDLHEELRNAPGNTRLFTETTEPAFQLAHAVWMARPDYHVPEEIEALLFDKDPGTFIRGTAETASTTLGWEPPVERPEGAPSAMVLGPRRTLLSMYHGGDFTLGTSRHPWLDGAQSHGLFATVCRRAPGPEALLDHRQAAIYYARHFRGEDCPVLGIEPPANPHFKDQGEFRAHQHLGTAMVFYHTHPLHARVKDLRTGIFRPLRYHSPEEIRVGEIRVDPAGCITPDLLPIAIADGPVFIGIVPLMGPSLAESRQARLQILTASNTLSILFSVCEAWSPVQLSYADQLNARTGFVFEIHPRGDFPDFPAFRRFLASARVTDEFYSLTRETTYSRPGLELAAAYSPFHSSFLHASVNGDAVRPDAFVVEAPGPHGKASG